MNTLKNNLKIIFENKDKYLLTNELNLQRRLSALQVFLYKLFDIL
jgi:hypothetical protein